MFQTSEEMNEPQMLANRLLTIFNNHQGKIKMRKNPVPDPAGIPPQQLQSFQIVIVVLALLQSTRASCDYSPSDMFLDQVRLSRTMNITDTRFRMFLGVTLTDCEKECGLRKLCRAYSYHRVINLCELHAVEVDEDIQHTFSMYQPESVLRKMTSAARNVILSECGRGDCPPGTVCTCGVARPTCEIAECEKPVTPEHVIILGNRYSVGSRISSICARGYAPALGVGLTRVCQPDGRWNGSDPVCGLACERLTPPSNGSVRVSVRNIYPSVAEFQCNEYYVLVGSPVMMCQRDGTWNDTAPLCVSEDLYQQGIDCREPDAPADGTVVRTGTALWSIATYTCDSGYDLSGVTERRCLTNSQWSETVPTCTIKDCGGLVAPVDGAVDIPTGTTFGSAVDYSCSDGFDLMGVASRTCSEDGSWTDIGPTCQIKDCGSLVAPVDGSVDVSSGTTFGSVADYSCRDGYDLIGAASVTCSQAGTWSDTAPVCEIKDCGSMRAPVHGSVVRTTGTTYGSVVEFSCQVGFDLIGSVATTCSADGFWSDSTPVCQIKDCGILVAPVDGSVDISSGTTFGSVAEYSCRDGYDLIGAASVTCLEAGTWSDTAPVCEIKDCGPLEDPVDGSVETLSGTTFGSVGEYTCNEGYDLDGEAVVECLEDASWSHSAPTCIIKDCGPPPKVDKGSVSADGTTYGATATYSCDAKYVLVGSSVSTCLSDGTWSLTSTACEREAMMFQPCTSNGDCWEQHSVCRNQLCGCDMGYSYLPGQSECVKTACSQLGTSFQIFEQYYLAENDIITYYGITLQQCKQACIENDMCLSADYETGSEACRLSGESSNTKSLWMTAARGSVYLHRDCACEGLQCTGCPVISPVENATLYSISLADGAVLGTELGVKWLYLCNSHYHMNGQTFIEKECIENGVWTNAEARCQYETYNNVICDDDAVCLEPNSECRATTPLCSCRIGYSYSQADFSCVEDCVEYGDTFQYLTDYRLEIGAEHILMTFNDVDITQCEKSCLQEQSESGMVCKSADHNTRTGECHLYHETARTMPAQLIETMNSGYTYLHRDCLCPDDRSTCTACYERQPVPNATLTEIHMPEGAVLGTEHGVVKVYVCYDGYHNEGSKIINTECANRMWTDLYAVCLPESMFLTCSGDWDCTEPNSECRDTVEPGVKKCGCMLHFTYFPDDFSCSNAECPNYGTTFQEFPSTKLLENDGTTSIKSKSLTDCMNTCADDMPVACRSFSFNVATMECQLHLSAVGAGISVIDDANFAYYHRDCGSADEEGSTWIAGGI